MKDVHMARGFSYKKSVHQIPAHRDLYRDIRKESVGNMVSLGKDSFPFHIKNWGIFDIFISTDDTIAMTVHTYRTSADCPVISVAGSPDLVTTSPCCLPHSFLSSSLKYIRILLT